MNELEQDVHEATKNFDGSTLNPGIADPNALPFKNGTSQPLFGSKLNKDSMLNNPGDWGGDARVPSPVPMYAYGHEGEGDTLFDLNPQKKG